MKLLKWLVLLPLFLLAFLVLIDEYGKLRCAPNADITLSMAKSIVAQLNTNDDFPQYILKLSDMKEVAYKFETCKNNSLKLNRRAELSSVKESCYFSVNNTKYWIHLEYFGNKYFDENTNISIRIGKVDPTHNNTSFNIYTLKRHKLIAKQKEFENNFILNKMYIDEEFQPILKQIKFYYKWVLIKKGTVYGGKGICMFKKFGSQ